VAILPTKQTFGGKPKPVAALTGVTGGRYPPSAGYMLHTMASLRGHRSCVADQPVGNLVGAIGWCGTFGGSLCSWMSRAGCFGTPLSVHFDRRLWAAGPARLSRGVAGHGSYLVDSASSHMLVSKIKPCMSKYKQSIQ
jgi:hypothetical protein